mmetsp:Transcript_1225/g.1707  ORF Transcript_1225/g.1707 Transcript_1225/m.1707 type:complete len:231 (+) Transcript_1225:633-1325(+)
MIKITNLEHLHLLLVPKKKSNVKSKSSKKHSPNGMANNGNVIALCKSIVLVVKQFMVVWAVSLYLAIKVIKSLKILPLPKLVPSTQIQMVVMQLPPLPPPPLRLMMMKKLRPLSTNKLFQQAATHLTRQMTLTINLTLRIAPLTMNHRAVNLHTQIKMKVVVIMQQKIPHIQPVKAVNHTLPINPTNLHRLYQQMMMTMTTKMQHEGSMKYEKIFNVDGMQKSKKNHLQM